MLQKKNKTQVTVTVAQTSDSQLTDVSIPSTHTKLSEPVTIREATEVNSIEDALAAMMEILNLYFMQDKDGNIRVFGKDEYVDTEIYSPYFKTVEVESGQVNRLINTKSNGEGVIGLPAVFMHFIDMHWDVGTYSIGSIKSTFRMKVVLNRLDIDSYDGQMDAYRVAHKLMECINAHKGEYSAFTRKFQLDYLDMMESWTKGIQYFWVTYQCWLSDYSTYSYRNYIERHVVVPPFTNHSDQDSGNNDFGHTDHTEKTFEESVQTIIPDGTERIPIRK